MVIYTTVSNGHGGNNYVNLNQFKGQKDLHVYVNLTNRCPCSCTFCLRQTKKMLESNTLWLRKEPTVEEVIAEFDEYDVNDFAEVTFCGFGEPTERFDDIKKVAAYLKNRRADLPIRINTNGLGNLVNDRDIAPECKGLVDTMSISLNAPTKEEFLELTRSKYGMISFNEMLDFAVRCKPYVKKVVLTVVDIIGEEKIAACQKICDDLGVVLRVRVYEE